MLDPRLEELPGVGAATARRLATVGITSVRDLAAAETEALTVLPRLGKVRSEALVAAARAVLAANEVPGARPRTAAAPAPGRGAEKAAKVAQKAAAAEGKAAKKAEKKAEKKAAKKAEKKAAKKAEKKAEKGRKKAEKKAEKKAAKGRKKVAKAAKGRG